MRFTSESVYRQKLGISVIEDEIHFLLFCPMYNSYRTDLIPATFRVNPSPEKAIALLSIKTPHTLNNLANFVFKAMIVREHAIKTLLT